MLVNSSLKKYFYLVYVPIVLLILILYYMLWLLVVIIFFSGMLGSGMCIMSRYPIIDVHYHSFLLNGYLHMVWHGDWFGGKGIGLCRINVKGFIVDVYTTHVNLKI